MNCLVRKGPGQSGKLAGIKRPNGALKLKIRCPYDIGHRITDGSGPQSVNRLEFSIPVETSGDADVLRAILRDLQGSPGVR